MTPFLQTLSVVGAVVIAIAGGIMSLSLFFRGMGWLFDQGATPGTLAVRGILKKETLATVHLVGSTTFERVRFIGFTNTESTKMRLPYELNGMVILEDQERKRYFVRAKDIRMIVVPPEADGGRAS